MFFEVKLLKDSKTQTHMLFSVVPFYKSSSRFVFRCCCCIVVCCHHRPDYVAHSQGTVIIRPEMDHCSGATGPRPIANTSSPGTTLQMTVDDGGNVPTNNCGGVEIDAPGIWWWVEGTGQVIRASSCDERTEIKVKMSVFTGSCSALRCVAGGSRSDYECGLATRGPEGEWTTISTAVDFPTVVGQPYYILVQQISDDSPEDAGSVWMRFRPANNPPNSRCVNAVGPVPHDGTRVVGTTEDSAVSELPDYCFAEPHYPGVWYHVVGTGGFVTVSACAENNKDGFYFSVYRGGSCDVDDMECVSGLYKYDDDAGRCTIEGNVRMQTSFEFQTRDGDRYYVYVHYALTDVDKPTSSFRLFVDDGKNGASTYPQEDFIANPNLNDQNKTQQQQRFPMLGIPSWERFDARWSLKVNDQCLYEFVFQFRHDDTLPIGEPNFQGRCALQDPTVDREEGGDGMLYLEPRQHWEMFPDYVWETIGFNHLSVDWLACGHRPRGYAAPQYDLSFYRATPEYRADQMRCELREDDGMDQNGLIPGEQFCTFQQESSEGMRFYIVPAAMINREPVVNMPVAFRRLEGNIAVPHVGLRSFDQDLVPEFPNQWDDIALFMSTYDGDLAMWQAQIPYTRISGREDLFTAGAAQYFETTVATLPDTYAFDYDDDGIIRFIAMGKSNLCREEFEAAEAAFFATVPIGPPSTNNPAQPPSSGSATPSPTPSNPTATNPAPSNAPSDLTYYSPPTEDGDGDGQPSSDDDDGDRLFSIGQLFGISFAAIIALCCWCALIACLCHKRKDSDEGDDEEDKEDFIVTDNYDDEDLMDEEDDVEDDDESYDEEESDEDSDVFEDESEDDDDYISEEEDEGSSWGEDDDTYDNDEAVV